MRKLATAAAVSLALASGGAFGLGLGDIEMQSALNQPMDAEIRLTSAKPGELDGMIVQLASPEAFARAGIDRSTALTDLRFRIDQSSGVPVIKIESSRPVVEPFLNFLLEVDWPQGRMVREYTVLLDPPVFMSPSASERNVAADQPAIVENGESANVVPTPIERDISSIDDGFAVELSEFEEFAPEEAVLSLDEATSISLADDEGELVSLDDLSDESLLSIGNGNSNGNSNSAPDFEGDVVALTDLNAPNTDAIEQRDIGELLRPGFDDIQVEVPDSTDEVTDNFFLGEDGQLQSNLEEDDGSILVSLDDIEVSGQGPLDITGERDVTVGRGDTLYEIARANAPSGVSVQQMMMAMLASNESAFINNNINLVRAGAILRVPEIADVNKLTQSQALAAIGDQNQLWQDYRDSLRGTAATQVAQTTLLPAESGAGVAQGQSDSEFITDFETASLGRDEALDGLSAEARAILESARQEVLSRDELKIVADNSPSSTSASATADETTDSDDTARIGEVNRKLQLAREELAATRLNADDLSGQASDLQNTTESLDAMVSLRQNEIARLESQLSEARNNADLAAETNLAAEAESEALALAEAAAQEAENAAAEAASNAAELAENTASEAADLAGNAVSDAADLAGNAASQASDGVANAVTATGDAISDLGTVGTNALTEAGETLDEVELLPSDGEDAATTIADNADAALNNRAEAQTWYKQFLEDPKRMAIAGVGGLGLLGVLGTLLFRRKRQDPHVSGLDAFDEEEFNRAEPPVAETAAQQTNGRLDATDAFNSAGAAGAAGVAGIAGAAVSTLSDKNDEAHDRLDDTFSGRMEDDGHDTLAFGADAVADSFSDFGDEIDDDDIDKDDTISEVDVYLAYGLHGQAQELLSKAIERKPDNEVYAHKLLETYHAQGNREAFHTAAADFHGRFGGNENSSWSEIAGMGYELNPNDPLYGAASAKVLAVGSGGPDGATSNASDFDKFGDSLTANSVNRGVGADLDDLSEGKSGLMDESIDPAFAFDEGDLEATGDFSAIAEQLTAENGGEDGIDFPDVEDAGSAANEALKNLTLDDVDTDLSDFATIEQLEGLGGSMDDLTLDLDQLSGDLDLDSADLLNSDLSELDIPELSADSELLLDSTGALGNDANEMDTMLDLAKAYIDMGDKDSASSALGEIVKSGSPEQVTEAETLLRNIS